MNIIKTFVILVLSLMTVTLQGKENLEELKKKLIRDGYEKHRIESLFTDKRFKIFKNIELRYKKTSKTNFAGKEFGFLSQKTIKQGKSFMKKYNKTLQKAEKRFGVNRTHITAIFALENGFGKFLGDREVLNSLATHCVYGKKGEWFYRQLKEYLDLKGKLYNDEFEIKGSYSGAFGYAQMMPELFKEYGIDFNQDGKIDPFDIEDTIGFIANFLAGEGYREDKKKAIFGYNHSENYVKAVILYAERIK